MGLDPSSRPTKPPNAEMTLPTVSDNFEPTTQLEKAWAETATKIRGRQSVAKALLLSLLLHERFQSG